MMDEEYFVYHKSELFEPIHLPCGRIDRKSNSLVNSLKCYHYIAKVWRLHLKIILIHLKNILKNSRNRLIFCRYVR